MARPSNTSFAGRRFAEREGSGVASGQQTALFPEFSLLVCFFPSNPHGGRGWSHSGLGPFWKADSGSRLSLADITS